MLIHSLTSTTFPVKMSWSRRLQEMERKNFPGMKSSSTYKSNAGFSNVLCSFKTVMTLLKTVERFATGQEHGKSRVTYFYSLNLTRGTEETTMLLSDATEPDF